MKTTREEMKKEAIKRMRALRIIGDAVKQFQIDDTVMVSERGILYTLNDEQTEAVKEWEEQCKGLVYMVIYSRTEFG